MLFPAIHTEVDWSQGYSFMDKELQQVTPDANSGRRYADKLIQVFAKDGKETWVLIHVEVQGEPEQAFAERMFIYNYRLRDRYQVDVVSLAVLADTTESFRPSCFTQERWGCSLDFNFPTAKLIDWERRWTVLEASANVFALVVMAQIQAKRIKDGASREQVKIGLVRLLYERGYSRKQVVELFNIIDWMIQLPKGLELGFTQKVHNLQEEKKMAYINTIHRVQLEQAEEQGVLKGMEKGLEKGRMEGRMEGATDILQNMLQLKFGEVPDWAQQRLQQATPEQLKEWSGAILTANSLEAMLGQH